MDNADETISTLNSILEGATSQEDQTLENLELVTDILTDTAGLLAMGLKVNQEVCARVRVCACEVFHSLQRTQWR